MQLTDGEELQRTPMRPPEKWKVAGSIPALATGLSLPDLPRRGSRPHRVPTSGPAGRSCSGLTLNASYNFGASEVNPIRSTRTYRFDAVSRCASMLRAPRWSVAAARCPAIWHQSADDTSPARLAVELASTAANARRAAQIVSAVGWRGVCGDGSAETAQCPDQGPVRLRSTSPTQVMPPKCPQAADGTC